MRAIKKPGNGPKIEPLPGFLFIAALISKADETQAKNRKILI